MSSASRSRTVPPVILFAYNRPDHLTRTLEALARNTLAAEADLTVYSDAARSEEDRPGVEAVRGLIARATGFRSVRAVLRQQNLGLAQNIIAGVGEAVEAHGRVIVLEDDIVTSPHFLTYMCDALEAYADDERVMHISGCRYPIRVPEAEGETFFLRVPLCWGWGTWSRAWQHFRRDLGVFEGFTPEERRSFDFDDTQSYWKQAEGNIHGRMKTWFIFWYACLFRRGGLALFPRRAQAQNIGHDGSGVHCGRSVKFDVELASEPVEVRIREVVESPAIFGAHRRYFRHLRAPRWCRTLALRLGLAPLG